MTRPRLRPLAPHDPSLPALVGLIRDAFRPVHDRIGGFSPALDASEGWLGHKLTEGPGYVADGPEGPVACAFMRPSRDVSGAWYLGTVAVAEAARGQGLARQLEARAEAEARARGLATLTLDTWGDSRGPRPLFEHLGYAVIAEKNGVASMTRSLPQPRRVPSDDPALPAILSLIRGEFAYMEGRIDPPSSMLRLTLADIARQAETGEVWVIGAPVRACVFLTPMPDRLYIGKLAVAGMARGRGLARALFLCAEDRARALGLPLLELQTRVELTGNHATFRRLGFRETGRTAHPGFDRPTSITFAKPVSG